MGSFIQVSTIQAIAHSVEVPKLTDEAAKSLAPDVEYRLREVVQEALKFAKHCKRLRLTAEDVNNALRLRNVEPIFGLSSRDPAKFVRAAGHPDLFYLRDRELGFSELIEAPLPKLPLEVGVSPHWLFINGQQPRVPENTPLEGPPAKRQRLESRAAASGAALGSNSAAAASAPAAAQGGRSGADTAAPPRPGGSRGAVSAALHLTPLAAPDAGVAVAVQPPVRHAISKELQVYFDKVVALVNAANGAAAAAAVAAGAPALAGLATAPSSGAGGQQLGGVGGGAGDAQHLALLRGALSSLSSDVGLHPLAPYFVAFIAEGVASSLRDLPRLSRLLSLAGALLANPTVHLEHYLHQLLAPLLTCVVTKTLGATASDDHWGVRDQAAQLVAAVCRRYGEPYHNVLPRVVRMLLRALGQPRDALPSVYGGIVGLQALGHAVVRAKLLQHVVPLLEVLQPLMESGAAVGEVARQEAWCCYGALLAATAGAMYDRLVGTLAGKLPNWLVFRRRKAARPASAAAAAGGSTSKHEKLPQPHGQQVDEANGHTGSGTDGGKAVAVRGGWEAAGQDTAGSSSFSAVLAEAWKDDSDVKAVLGALVALFGDSFLAAMPLGEAPAYFL